MKDEKSKITAVAIEKMIDFYQGNLRDIEHFLKVWAYAKTIGEQESVDENTQGILELGYLYRISDPRPEDVVDEMLAILSDRNAIIQKKESEHAQATINKVYREGL